MPLINYGKGLQLGWSAICVITDSTSEGTLE